MRLNGQRDQIHDELRKRFPGCDGALKRARAIVPAGKQEVMPYQAAVLFGLMSAYNQPEAQILEIGTYYGYTAAVMAQAAPRAMILTLNPTPWEWEGAVKRLGVFFNVRAVCAKSWDYLQTYAGGPLDAVFVDGDHKRVRLDLPWWNRLKPGGLMLFHDYTPLGNPRHCPPVYEALNAWAGYLGREFDVLIVDHENVGMAGFYKRPGDPEWSEEWQTNT